MSKELDDSQEMSRYLNWLEVSAIFVLLSNIVCALIALITSSANLLALVADLENTMTLGWLVFSWIIVYGLSESNYAFFIPITALNTIFIVATLRQIGSLWPPILASCIVISLPIISAAKKIRNPPFIFKLII